MLSANQAAKSIIKQSSAISKESPKVPTLSREERNRQLALHHARLLQDRKDIESEILASTEKLLEFPSSETASPPDPSAEDIATVKEALWLFQPSDYDALVEERNINNQCGYIFCSRANKRLNAGGKYRMVTGRKSDLKFVESTELEKWCSDNCGHRALYLRAQLSNEPAWTRDSKDGDPLLIYKEGNHQSQGHDKSTPQAAEDPNLTRDKATKSRMEALAMERGDRDNTMTVSTKVTIRVKENINQGREAPVPPSMEDNHSGSIEGYVPMGKDALQPSNGQKDDVDDLMPTI
ncbi:MAG: hypothetical protein LQ350_006604 [Teloschistes chrysophthalmus]|nr:MAG: hypothetical protein LQ350_006604 [Niorma chrysophthalma]